MSQLSDFMTQGTFWWGVIGSGAITGSATYFGVRGSDKRKARQEDKTNERKEQVEREKEDRKKLDEVLLPFITEATAQLNRFIDRDHLYNFIRDRMEPFDTPEAIQLAEDKAAFETARAQDFSKLKQLFATLSTNAPVDLMNGANDVCQLFDLMNGAIGNPASSGPLWRKCEQAINSLIDAYRSHIGKTPYLGIIKPFREVAYLIEIQNQLDLYRREFAQTVIDHNYTLPMPQPET